MINLSSATEIAQEAMDALQIERPLVLLDEVDEMDAYWIFYFNDSRYVETDDPTFDLVGIGPIAVAKEDGAVMYLSGAEPAEDQLR